MKRINIISFKAKRLILISALFAGLLFTFVSCQKDFLDIQPKNSLTEAAVFEDPALLESFVNYTYRMTPHGFAEVGGILPLATMVDEAHSKGNVASVGQILAGNARPDYMHALNVWTGGNLNNRNYKSYWTPIKQCNEFLDKVSESENIDHSLLTRMTGEIKALRAYAYFRLISHYGGVPLATKPFSVDDWQIPRSSYDDVMSFILSELDEAIDMLPLSYSGNNVGRITKGAAMAIKARALLYYASPLNNQGNDLSRWQAAADAAKAVIDLNVYELYPDYQAIFQEKTGYHSEIIWARQFIHILRREVYIERRLFANGWRGHGHAPPIQNLVDDRIPNPVNLIPELPLIQFEFFETGSVIIIAL